MPQSMHALEHPTSAATTAPDYPTLEQIVAVAQRLQAQGHVQRTPVWRWQTGAVRQALAPATEVWLKLELFQTTGTFKLRGALNCIAALDPAARARGVVAASAGNHAIAVAYTAQISGIGATVVMPATASADRIAACRQFGAEVVLAATVHEAFRRAAEIADGEGRTMMHPYEGPLTAQGTATVGLELMQQVPQLDAVVVPVGGGGLCAGIAAAVKQINPRCAVVGVEPFGADALYRSFQSGVPERLERVDTVADSLGAPAALPYSFGVCRRFVDDVVRVTDDDICRAMFYLYRDMKLVAEPAAAVATAALLNPLQRRFDGRRVGLIVCGSNVTAARFAELVARGEQLQVACL